MNAITDKNSTILTPINCPLSLIRDNNLAYSYARAPKHKNGRSSDTTLEDRMRIRCALDKGYKVKQIVQIYKCYGYTESQVRYVINKPDRPAKYRCGRKPRKPRPAKDPELRVPVTFTCRCLMVHTHPCPIRETPHSSSSTHQSKT